MRMLNRREVLAGAAGLAVAGKTRANDSADAGVVELRQYTLRGGQRDTLISLFESKFVDPQNAVGARVIGTFRDLDDPDRFVWIRGFRDMAARQEALQAFYGDAVWQANRAAANATMVDSDNVMLLRPSGPGQGFAGVSRPQPNTGSVIGATVYYLGAVSAVEFNHFFEASVLPHLQALQVQPIARLVTAEVPNNYPKLPVREHERVFIWFARWPDSDAEKSFAERLSKLSGWRDSAAESVLPALMRKPERLRLAPTALSALR